MNWATVGKVIDDYESAFFGINLSSKISLGHYVLSMLFCVSMMLGPTHTKVIVISCYIFVTSILSFVMKYLEIELKELDQELERLKRDR